MLVFFLLLALKINIFSVKNGAGLEIDQEILKHELEILGCEVRCRNMEPPTRKIPPYADINIFFERISSNWIRHASLNWFVPNLEWFDQDLSLNPIGYLSACWALAKSTRYK